MLINRILSFVVLFTILLFCFPVMAADYTAAEMQAKLNDVKNGNEFAKIQAPLFFIDHPATPVAYDILLYALTNELSVDIRYNLASAVSLYKNDTALPALKKYLDDVVKTGKSNLQFDNAYVAVATIGGNEAIEIVNNGLKSDNVKVKNASVRAVAYGLKDLPRVFTFLSDNEKSTRITAIEVLEYVATPAEAFDNLQPLLARKADKDEYDAILAAMTTIRDPRAVDALVAALENENPDLRVIAAKNMGEKKVDKIVDALIKALATDKVAEVRRQAVESLTSLSDPKAIPFFIEALKDNNVGVRAGAAKALGTEAFVDKTAFQPLLDALADEAGVVSANVALSLGAYQYKEAIKPLQLAMRNEYNLTRSNAIRSLFAIGGDEVMDIIGKGMAREVDRKVLSSLIYVMKKMKTDKEAASKYIDMAIKNSKDDNTRLFNEGHSAQIQLGGMPKAPAPAAP